MKKYQDILTEIEKLEREATRLRRIELKEVIQSIKAQIKQFGLSGSDLGFREYSPTTKGKVSTQNGGRKQPHRKIGQRGSAKSKATGKVLPPKFRNPHGTETWTGRGRTPLWVRKAMDDGYSLDSIRIVQVTTDVEKSVM